MNKPNKMTVTTTTMIVVDAATFGDSLASRAPIGSYGAALGLPVVRINAFEVDKHDIEIQVVLVLCFRVLDDGGGDGMLVIAAELAAASRALLLILHGANLPLT